MYGMLKAWELFKRASPDNFMDMFGNETHSIDAMMLAAAPFIPTLAPLMPFGPVADGTDVGMPKLPYDSIAAGEANKIPFMMGTTSNEGSMFLPMIPSVVKGINHLPLKTDDVPLIIHHVLDPVIGEDVVTEMLPELLDIYNINDYPNVDAQVSRILRDYVFTCSTRRAAREFARHTDEPVYMYQFNYMTRWVDFKLLGCYHTSEVYFVFDNSWPPIVHPFSRDDKTVASNIQNYWTK
jgi:para-nitrobenzyl esterase